MWFDQLKKAFDKKKSEAAPDSLALPKAIWGLNSNLIITTNFDKVLEWSCPDKDDLVSWDIESKKEFTDFLQKEVDKPTLWHLHGKIDNTSELIITPDGYHKLYPKNNEESVKVKYEAALKTFRNVLQSYSLLFIGFSMDDDFVRNQVKLISETFDNSTGPHYILVRKKNKNQLEKDLGDSTIFKIVTFEDFGDPLVDTINELASHELNSQKKPNSYSPRMLWRGGHYSNKTSTLIKVLKSKNKNYSDLFLKIEDSINSILETHPTWNDHRMQVQTYLGELIPDEVKIEKLSETEIVSLLILSLRCAEFEIEKIDSILANRINHLIYSEISVLDESEEISSITIKVYNALKENKDIVSRTLSSTNSQILNFILGCLKLVRNIDLFFNRIPLKTFNELAPHNRLEKIELARTNFLIENIKLDFNLHEVGIYASCKNSAVHQLLATLCDYLNQTLNAVSQSLESKQISLLRVKFYPKTLDYTGEHHEFQTQISTVISMFMGEELYGKQRVFLRELLQNARDAVLLRKSVKEQKGIKDFEPVVSFSLDSKEQTLICKDNGIGMDYYSIKRYLSDIGRSFYTSSDYKNMLRGVSKKENNSPVSRFGIGLLSCFMVASKVSIRTKMDGENQKGYKIDIPSRGAFFFVSEDSSIDFVGTEVKLELKPDSLEKNSKWNNPIPHLKTWVVDIGIKIFKGNKFINLDNYKSFVTRDKKWLLPRLISYYACNLPFSININDDGRISVIEKNRIFTKLHSNV